MRSQDFAKCEEIALQSASIIRRMPANQTIRILDSHTGGEPTRLVLSGGPDLGQGSLAERRARFDLEAGPFRRAVLLEPRGSEVLVGALLQEPSDSSCSAGVLFFNNVGSLGMCGHGTIGLCVSLAHLGLLAPGAHRIETPVGIVDVELLGQNEVSVENVASYRHAKDVQVEVEGIGPIRGDVAWGGNWFFLVGEHGQELVPQRTEELTDFCWRIRQALEAAGITGAGGGLIDHIELFGPPRSPDADSQNFVLCPGGAYDRSPCGTGTSAKLACLQSEGRLDEGQTWRQESIIGSIFEASYRKVEAQILPTIRGQAWITAEGNLILDSQDPYRHGIPQ